MCPSSAPKSRGISFLMSLLALVAVALPWGRSGEAIAQAVTLQSGLGITTSAGVFDPPGGGYAGDNGPATSALMSEPWGLAMDKAGNLYISDATDGVIRKVDTSGIITTFAGGGNGAGGGGILGDGGPATAAGFNVPQGIAFDGNGNLYVVDSSNSLVRKIDTSGIITTVAGTTPPCNSCGVQDRGFSGDNGPATKAQLYYPDGIAVDSAGNLYIADTLNSRIRRVSTSGIITTFAGNGTQAYSGDSGPATQASLNQPTGLAFDSFGNLYVADTGNSVIREISSGTIRTVVGNGQYGKSGDNGSATAASLMKPEGIVFDAAGNLYISDNAASTVRKVDTTNTITTIAGGGTGGTSGSQYSGDGGPATSATMHIPRGLVFNAAGNLFIADWGNNVVRELVNISETGVTFPTTPVGTSSNSMRVVLEVTAGTQFNKTPYAVRQDGTPDPEYSVTFDYAWYGCIAPPSDPFPVDEPCWLKMTFTPSYPGQRPAALVADTSAGKFYFGLNGIGTGPQVAITPGTIASVAGIASMPGFSGDAGAGSAAKVNIPLGTSVDIAGNMYFADSANNRIRKVSSSGTITTIAGNGSKGFAGDNGPATSAELSNPTDVVIDGQGNFYVADQGNNCIRKIDSAGKITTVAGNGTQGFSGDGGVATSAELYSPNALALDAASNLYIADAGNYRIRKVSASGTITTVAGNGTQGFSGDGGSGTSAEISNAGGVALDIAGNLYIADTGNNRIRELSASGTITTIAGTGTSGFSGDNASATNAELHAPSEVKTDAAGNVYIADTGNNRVREISASGTIITVAGNGSNVFGGDNGPSTSAGLNAPSGIALDSMGDLYIADSGNNVLREVNVQTPGLAFASTAVGSTSTDSPQEVTVSNIGNMALSFTVPTTGTNPSVSTNFAIGYTGNCPHLSATSSPSTLAVGNSCTTSLSFTPTVSGTISGSATVSDNALNVITSVQTIKLSGVATEPASVTTISVTTPTYGQTQVSATITPPSPANLVMGSVVFTVDGVAQPPITIMPNMSGGPSMVTLPASIAGTLSVGSHTISAAFTSSSAALGNSTASTTFTTAQAPLTVTAANATRGYGIANPTFNVTLTGLVNGDFFESMATTTATATSPAGSYPIVPSLIPGGKIASYNVTYVNGSLTVTGAPATVTAALNPTAPVYGQAVTLTVTATSGGASVAGSTATVTAGGQNYTCTTSASGLCAVTIPGAVLQAGIDPLTITTSGVSSAAAGSTSLSVIVAPATLTLTAANVTRTYGSANPVFTVTYTGAVGADTFTTAATTTATTSSPAGTYKIIPTASGSNSVNYIIMGLPGTLTVRQAEFTTVTASVSPAAPSFGQSAVVTVTAMAAGLPVSGSTASVVVGGQSYTCTTDVNGHCTVTLPGGVLQGGSNTIAVGTTDTTNAPAGRANATVTVTPSAATVVTASINPAAPQYGQSAVVTVTATTGGLPVSRSTGTITVAGHSYTCTTDATGQCTLTIPGGVLQAGNDSLAVVSSATANAPAGSSTTAVTVHQAALTVTATSASNTLGTPIPILSGTYTGAVNGDTFTVSATTNATSTSPSGTYTISPTVTGANLANYAVTYVNGTLTLSSSIAVVTTSISPATPAYGQPVTVTVTATSVPAGSATGATGAGGTPIAGSTGTISVGGATYSCTTNTTGKCTVTVPGGVLQAGSDPLTVSTSPTATATASTATNSVAISKATTTLALGSSSSTANPGASVTLTATVVSVPAGTPTGAVTFYDNGTQIGTGTLSAGSASLTLTTLPTGSDSITAVYAGNANFAASTAVAYPETVNVADFTITATGATPTATGSTESINRGATATYALALSGLNGFSGPVSLTATGLPPNATVNFSPAVVTITGTVSSPGTMTIVTSATQAQLTTPVTPGSRGTSPISYGLLLPLPLLAIVRLRKRLLSLPRTVLLVVLGLVSLGAMTAGLTGCAGGYVGSAPQTYTITVTGTSGTLQHSATVTLNVQ